MYSRSFREREEQWGENIALRSSSADRAGAG